MHIVKSFFTPTSLDLFKISFKLKDPNNLLTKGKEGITVALIPKNKNSLQVTMRFRMHGNHSSNMFCGSCQNFSSVPQLCSTRNESEHKNTVIRNRQKNA